MQSPATIGRQSRVLQILSRLQAGESLTVSQLAAETKVCRRTVFRDLNLLRDAGLGVQYDERSRGYRLADPMQWTVTPQLGPEELTTLLTAAELSILRPLPHFADQLEQAAHKLLANCPAAVRHAVVRVTTACEVRVPEGTDMDQTVHIVRSVLQGIRERRILRITIAGSGQRRMRTRFAPYQMIATAHFWEVVGRSSAHRAIRTFDPRQFLRAELTEQPYAIPRQYNRRT